MAIVIVPELVSSTHDVEDEKLVKDEQFEGVELAKVISEGMSISNVYPYEFTNDMFVATLRVMEKSVSTVVVEADIEVTFASPGS